MPGTRHSRIYAAAFCLLAPCLPGAAQQSDVHQTLIEQVRENVLAYDKRLPDFLCEEIIRRYYDPDMSESNWRSIDTVSAQLTYFEGHENYTQIRLNKKLAPKATMLSLSGTTAEGEFGTLVKNIFRPDSQADFEWDYAGTLRGRSVSVFGYDIKSQHSRYRIGADGATYRPAYRGQVFVDDQTKLVLRLFMTAYDIPSSFAIKSVTTAVDYDFANVGGKPYLLPIHAEIISNHHAVSTKNVEEFRDYRKFAAESSVNFDTPDEPKVPVKP